MITTKHIHIIKQKKSILMVDDFKDKVFEIYIAFPV